MAIPKTLIQNKVLLPDGSAPASGYLVAKLSQPGSALDGSTSQRVGAADRAILGADGSLPTGWGLVPNDAITPSGTYYSVEFHLKDADGIPYRWTEKWQIASSPSPIDIGAVPRLDVVPGVAVGVVAPQWGGDVGPATVTATGSTTARAEKDRWADVTNVKDFGAKGDGVTDDTLAVRAAITAAGAGGTVFFPPGDTYLMSSGLLLLPGQTLLGYGATLKRANAISTSTSTNIATGPSSTAITVASSTGFYVGMQVTVFNGANYDGANHAITNVAGNVLTVSTAFTTAFPTGGTVVSSHMTITNDPSSLTPANVTILGLTIDGNRSQNALLQKWDIHAEIRILGDRLTVRDVYVHDAQSEGIEFGGAGTTIEACRVIDSAGNGIHASGSSGATVRGCYVKNANLAGVGPGHADGGIIFSSSTGDSMIIGNYVENAISGVGSMDADDNSSVSIIGNIIKNCTSYAFEGYVPLNVKVGRIIIEGNLIYNSVKGTVSMAGASAGNGPYRITIADNYFEDTTLEVKYAQNVLVRGNQFMSPATTTGNAIWTYDVLGCSIEGNTVEGWGYGIVVDGSAGSANERIDVHANLVRNQYSRGINVNVALPAATKIDGNTITQTVGAGSASYWGINTANGVLITNNSLDLQGTGQYGINCPNGAASTNAAVVTNNWVRSTGYTGSIHTYGGSQNNWIVGNYTQQAIVNSGGGTNTVTGNYTIF